MVATRTRGSLLAQPKRETNRYITTISSSVASAFVDGWLLMLAFGFAHSSAPQVPAFGYWVCVFAAWVFAGIVAGPVGRRDYLRNGSV